MYDSIVIGAGQAGLAAGYYLQRAGLRFALLDAADGIGATWAQRWDSLRLFTPARYNGLPGMPFPGERYRLPGKDEVADYLKAYARQFDLHVRLGSRVRSLRKEGDTYCLTTDGSELLAARTVIVATGANQRPYVPAFAAALDSRIVQLHSSGYQRPAQLPSGSVLVVGAGNSGAQIALELAETGRHVVLSGPSTGSLPRRFLGRDIYDWLWPTLMRPPVHTTLGRRLMQGRLFAGDPLVGMSPKSLERESLRRAGRTVGVHEGMPRLEDGSVEDETVAVVWCTGFRPNFNWIELPIFGLDGYPLHHRGLVQTAPGIAFLGMRFQYRASSALLGGVGEDAAYVASETLKFLRMTTTPATRPESNQSAAATKFGDYVHFG